MIKKLVCKECGIEFEAVSMPSVGKFFCPNCSSEVDFQHGKSLEELGGYRLFEMLGQGGMGQVYRGVEKCGQQVAIKVMAHDACENSELRERFRREMAIMSSLHHENIVELLDRGETSYVKFFVMELIEGTTLRNVIREKELPQDRIIQISLQILSALSYAHTMGIIHRDIKPENILFDREGNVKVTDFGLARKISFDSTHGVSLTATNAFMGTESYMSPEQKFNPKGVTHKSDIYSFGVIIYEMLTGGMIPMGIFQPPSYYKQVDEFWDSLTFQMLDINPDLRPSNCQAIIDKLLAFRQQRNGPVIPKPLPSSEALPKNVSQTQSKLDILQMQRNSRVDTQDILVTENKRIQQRLKEIFQKAFDLYQKEKYEEALQLLENSLEAVSTESERSNFLTWINGCREKIKERSKKSAVAFLCPKCLKPFQRSSAEPMPEELYCPSCRTELRYDSARKRLFLKVAEPLIPPVEPKTEVRNVSANNSGPQKESFRFAQMLAFVFIGLWIFDFLDPSVLESAMKWVCDQGISERTGLSIGMVTLYFRFVFHAVLLIFVCYLFYSFYGIDKRRDRSRS